MAVNAGARASSPGHSGQRLDWRPAGRRRRAGGVVRDLERGAILGIDTTNAGAGPTYSGVIADSSAGTLGLTKLGGGQLTLSASNTYTGGTIVSAGTLVAANLTARGRATWPSTPTPR